MNFIRNTFGIGLTALALLSGCVRETSMRKDEYLLVGQSVKGSKEIESSSLLALVPQRPNRTFLNYLLPYLAFYRIAQQTYRKEKYQDQLRRLNDSCQRQQLLLQSDIRALERLENRCERETRRLNLKIEQGNWGMRVLGEPPSYITSQLAKSNAANMQTYLVSRGFRNAKVSFSLDTVFFSKRLSRIQQIKVVYRVDEGPPSYMGRISYQSDESRIDSLMEAARGKSRLKPGSRTDRDALETEKSRLETLFRDNGYYGFNRNDISIIGVDTFARERSRIDPIFIVEKPQRAETHPFFRIDSISVVVDGTLPGLPERTRIDSVRNAVKYTFIGRSYSLRLLDSKLTIRPGDVYSQQRITETQRRLGTLDQFRYPDMPFDTAHRQLNIYTNPLNRYQFSGEMGLNVFQGLPGPFTNASLRIRNILGGLESLDISGRVGFEGQTGFVVGNQPYRSFEAGINTSLIFPQILFPGNYKFRFNNSNPRTQVGVGFNYSDRPDYNRTNAKLALSYSWQRSATKTFYLSIFDANINKSNIKLDTFKRYLTYLDSAQGNPLYRSFQPSFVSSVSGSYVYSDNVVGQNRRARYFRIFLELGGTTLNFTPNGSFPFLNKIFGDLQFFKFFRINPDFRYYFPIGLHSNIAIRINVGVGIPYGSNSALPYEKYFFAGGTNSLRAWRPRRLGPGSYLKVAENGTVDELIEQPGNVLIEASTELRFPLIKLGGMLNGAVFVDAGNVWTVGPSGAERLGANFDVKRFYKEIALGTGLGVRWDFSFFIIRADWGIKVYEPALPAAQRWVLSKVSLTNSAYKPRLNIGIGYPF